MKTTRFLLSFTAATLFAMHIAQGQAIVRIPDGATVSGTYKLSKEIAVGGEGSWDYLTVDPSGRRLYVSHATKVVVIDLDKEEVVGEIADTPGVHGIAVAPERGRCFTSNGRENKRSIVAINTLTTMPKADT